MDGASTILDGGICSPCRILAREIETRKRRAHKESGVGSLHGKFRSWDELDGSAEYLATLAKLRAFLDVDSGFIVLVGPRGRGKTQVCAVVVYQTIEAGKSAKMITVHELLLDLKARFGTEGASEADWSAEWCKPHLLVIDEFSERIDSPYCAVALTSLLDRRYRHQLQTILVANCLPEQFAKLAGPSITDRVNEGGGILQFDRWMSYRLHPGTNYPKEPFA